MNNLRVQLYRQVKDNLNVKERYKPIFELRNGFTDGIWRTLTETGKKFRISASRVAQIEARMLYEIEIDTTPILGKANIKRINPNGYKL